MITVRACCAWLLLYSVQWFLPTGPRPKKIRTRPLEVLCLGMSRSGTESLRSALLQLGYKNVSHGFVWWFDNLHTGIYLYALAGKKLRGEFISAAEFDQVFGDCDAVTDIPAIWFAPELLAAYPDAKVVLNERRDVQQWKSSFRNSILPMMYSWTYWWTSLFHAELFWGNRLTNLMWMHVYFRNDFERNAIPAYEAHYRVLERKLEDQQREALRWKVQDGWSPLCRFLDKEVPKETFPEGNTADEFIPKLMAVDAQRMYKSRVRAVMLGIVCAVAIAISLYR